MGSFPKPKPMSKFLLFHLVILTIFSSSSTQFVSCDDASPYELLQAYDFPSGLLPKGVIGYKLDRETGKFSAYLNGTCSFNIESYKLKYKSTISGQISKRKVKNLKGVSVKILLFWLNMVEVIRDGDELQFSVGIASADFAVDNFVESPQCGCGFDCNDLKKDLSSLLSSS